MTNLQTLSSLIKFFLNFGKFAMFYDEMEWHKHFWLKCMVVTVVVQFACIHSIYSISLKSRHTSKSCCPQNVAAYFSQVIPINAALEISRHGKGSTTIYVCERALYVHTGRFIIEAAYTHACQHRPQNLIVTTSNRALPQQNFKEIQYLHSVWQGLACIQVSCRICRCH